VEKPAAALEPVQAAQLVAGAAGAGSAVSGAAGAGGRPPANRPQSESESAQALKSVVENESEFRATRRSYRIAAGAGDLQQALGLAETIDFD
jgi:hypothetical protein